MEEIIPEQWQKNGETAVSLHFCAMQSLVRASAERLSLNAPKEEQVQALTLEGALWDVKDMDRNSLTLDTCHYSIDGGIV